MREGYECLDGWTSIGQYLLGEDTLGNKASWFFLFLVLQCILLFGSVYNNTVWIFLFVDSEARRRWASLNANLKKKPD